MPDQPLTVYLCNRCERTVEIRHHEATDLTGERCECGGTFVVRPEWTTRFYVACTRCAAEVPLARLWPLPDVIFCEMCRDGRPS